LRITAIERQPRRRRYEVQIDFVLRLTLSPEVYATSALRAGQEITLEQVTALEERQARHFAMSTAMRLLAYRPRSEKEMRTALQRKGVKQAMLAETVSRLKETRLLDDGEFARSYVDQRDRTSPRSQRLLQAELRSKGVTAQAADEPVAEVDEGDAAYRAAARRARTISALPYADFQRRLGDFLLRRGFGYETSRDTVKRLWGELRVEAPEVDVAETPHA
jgi:regulatory protein